MGYLGQQATFTGTANNKRLSSTAAEGQTVFTVAGGYNINQLDVYRNGVKLSSTGDFIALDGTSVTLVTGASANDILEFVVFENFSVPDALTGSGDQSLNGNLSVTGYVAPTIPIAIASEAIRAGVATAADSLNGGATASNGINVSGITTTDFLEVDYNASFTGISTFSDDLNVTGTLDATSILGNISGTAATFTGNVTVGGTLTYDDVTNIDSVGLITARSGLQVLAGITTLNGQVSAGNLNVTGVVTAASFSGDGSALTGVISGIDIESGGSFLGAGVTSVNFDSGATVTSSGAGATITISAGLNTTAGFSTNTNRNLDLDSAQDHKYTVTGFVTFTCSGGTEGDSHTLRVINSGIATVGFNTFFLFPSGAAPSLPTTDGAISLISFTVNRVGTGGTQLLAGASVNFS